MQALSVVLWAALVAALDVRAPLELTNSGDLSYYAELFLNDKPFRVLVDTGSADLWVAGTVEGSHDTGHEGHVTYAVGDVKGPIKTAELRFSSYHVSNQSFMLVQPDEDHPEGSGILGLGPNTGSFIDDTFASTTGSPMLYRLFYQNYTAPNYFTILLGRDKDPTDTFSGSITISEILPEYSTIRNEPRVEIAKLPPELEDDQHLQVLLDADGLIGPDNQPIKVSSSVASTHDSSRLTVVLDSGFSLPQVPKSVAEAIYGRFQGAEYVSVYGIGSTYILPCDAEVNVTFKFAGKSYPMHPLDMTMEPSALGLGSVVNSRGEASCVATFQPFTYERKSNPTYDMVLGMAFMRNVYTLFDYGDFMEGPNDSTHPARDPPYIQFLSITDPSEAHRDFVDVRLGGVDKPPRPLLNTTNTSATDVRDNDDGGLKRTHITAIVASVAVISLLLLVAGILVVRARRRNLRIR